MPNNIHPHIKKLTIIAIIIGVFLYFFSTDIFSQQGKIYSLTIDGAISPANADYFIRGLDKAVENDADLLLLNLNTPGGLDKSMRLMIQVILSSPIPVVTYISPKGARGASAGTYLMYASHIAAMAPATNLGSATPVSIGMISPPEPEKDRTESKDSDNSSVDNRSPDNAESDEINPEETNPENRASDSNTENVMQRKIINDAEAYIRSLAQLRGRNEEWAVLAVSQAANLSANEALEKKVIDLIAYNQHELIKALHQRKVTLGDKTITLQLVEPEIIELTPDWRTEILIVITDPSLAYLLLLAGIYGLMFEFLNPGSLLPGTIGAICLIIALYALNMLPINMAGLILLLIGITLMIGEAFAPSFGVLGFGGIISFTIGSFMLMDTNLPGFQIAPALIISTALISAFIVIFVLSLLLKARGRPIVTGEQQLLDHLAIAVEDFDGHGRVIIGGEIWQADCSQVIKKEQAVRIKAIDGLTLIVMPLMSESETEIAGSEMSEPTMSKP